MKQRIYAVQNGSGEARLVRASNKAQAVHHCAKSVFHADLASQDDLLTMLGKNIKVEQAGEEASNE